MESRRFMILYQRQRDRTLEREVTGTLEEVLRMAWDMLQAGDAKVAAIVEPGNLEFHVWHNRIVHWGRQYGARDTKPAVRSTAQPAAMPGSAMPAPTMPAAAIPAAVAQRPVLRRPAA
jgi:hypothetical protein